MKVLIVEDDQEISTLLSNFLLDITLPDGNGLQLLKFIKNQNIEAGVLIISAKNSLDDKLLGLNLGADDYITKPFDLSELNARIIALFYSQQKPNVNQRSHSDPLVG